MQVADVSIFGPFKIYYSQECELWRRAHPGQLMSKYDIARVATPAWVKAASIDNVVSGFCQVGQHPFMPSAVLDKVGTSLRASAVVVVHHCCLTTYSLLCSQLAHAQTQALRRRTLSDVSRMQLDFQRLQAENARLQTENARLRAEQVVSATASAVRQVAAATAPPAVSAPALVLADYLVSQAGVHPSAKRRTKSCSDNVLKDGIAGAVLTKPGDHRQTARGGEAEESEGGEEGSSQGRFSLRSEATASA